MNSRRPYRYEPLADLSDRGNYYLLMVDLPHVSQDDVHIYLDGDTMIIHAETTYTDSDGGFNHVMYNREITIPRDADPSSIKVSFKQGMLKIIMGKTTHGKKEIPIRRLRLKVNWWRRQLSGYLTWWSARADPFSEARKP